MTSGRLGELTMIIADIWQSQKIRMDCPYLNEQRKFRYEEI
jgi:hypothetical protein